jgi:hypothetical protein
MKTIYRKMKNGGGGHEMWVNLGGRNKFKEGLPEREPVAFYTGAIYLPSVA